MTILVSSAFRRLVKTLGMVATCMMAADCSPLYSIGVQGTLTQPLSVDCILHAAQITDGVHHVLIHQNKPKEEGRVVKAVDDFIDPPTTYLVTTTDQRDAQIEQRPLNDGRAVLWVGRQDVGITPSQHTIEADQVFYVRLVSQIVAVCNGRYSDGITCVPATEACQKR